MNELRASKLQEAIKEKIATMIVRGEIKDHRVTSDINVTRVRISSDGTLAKVYVSSYKSMAHLEKACKGLESAKGFVSVMLGKMLTTRNTPKIAFFVDNSLREGFILGERIKEEFKNIKDNTDETDENQDEV